MAFMIYLKITIIQEDSLNIRLNTVYSIINKLDMAIIFIKTIVKNYYFTIKKDSNSLGRTSCHTSGANPLSKLAPAIDTTS